MFTRSAAKINAVIRSANGHDGYVVAATFAAVFVSVPRLIGRRVYEESEPRGMVVVLDANSPRILHVAGRKSHPPTCEGGTFIARCPSA